MLEMTRRGLPDKEGVSPRRKLRGVPCYVQEFMLSVFLTGPLNYPLIFFKLIR